MITQTRKVIHVVQGDSGRTVIVEIKDFSLASSMTATVTCRTAAKEIYGPITAQIMDGTKIKFTIPGDWTNTFGDAILTVTISKDGQQVSTFAIIMAVSVSAGFNGTPVANNGKIYVYVDGVATEIATKDDLSEIDTKADNISSDLSDFITETANNLSQINDEIVANEGTLENYKTEIEAVSNNLRVSGWSDPELKQYIALNGDKADITVPASSGSRWSWVCVPCSEGDAFIVSGDRGDAPRPYAFCDSGYNIILRAASGYVADNDYIVAPTDSAFLILNRKIGTKDSYKLAHQRVQNIKRRFSFDDWETHELITLAEVKADTQSSATSFTGCIKPATMQAYGTRLANAHPDDVSTNVYGVAPGCSDIYLTAYEFKNIIDRYASTSNYKRKENQPVVVITAGIHGNEVEMIYAAYKLMDEMLNTNKFAWLTDNYKVIIAPMVCPYGTQEGQRNNVNNVNINRNFRPYWSTYTGSDKGTAALSETETKFVNYLMTHYSADIYFDFRNCSGEADYGHALTFDPELYGTAQDIYTSEIRSTRRYTYAPDGSEIPWTYTGQSLSMPIVGAKLEPESFAHASSLGIKSILVESPIRANAISGNNSGRVLHSPEVVTYAYEKMVNTIKAVLMQYESEV